MSETNMVNCEHLVDNQLCKSIIEDESGLAVREKGCLETVKNLCCYLCSHRESCEISCSYLDKPGTSKVTDQKSVNVDQEIRQCQERIERLAGLLADGKIGEESYAAATKALENRLEALKKAKGNPNVMLSLLEELSDLKMYQAVDQRFYGILYLSSSEFSEELLAT